MSRNKEKKLNYPVTTESFGHVLNAISLIKRKKMKSNAVFRQAFLLIQYSFICKQYFFCSYREYQYFFDRW